MIEEKTAAFDQAAPGEPLGARQLMDAIARIYDFVDNLGHSPGTRRSARITGVLGEEAVRYENNAATACIK